MSASEMKPFRVRRPGGPAHVPLMEQLRFLTRVRVASPRQFGIALDHDVWWAYKRIEQLCKQGLAERSRPLRELPGIVWATPDGLAAAGLTRSRLPRPSVDRIGHDLAVTELLLSIEHAERQTVLSERELWRGAGEGPIDVAGGVSGPNRHCADLVVMMGETSWAAEVEFSLKGATRLRKILGAYRASPYEGVVYYVREPALARTISRLALEADVGDRLRIRPWRLWPAPSESADVIETIAQEHRAAASAAVTPIREERAQRPQVDDERAAAIEAWDRELARRDREHKGNRLRLRAVKGT